MPELLDAILTLLPLDSPATCPIVLMQTGDDVKEPPAIWETYQQIVQSHAAEDYPFHWQERYAFYEQVKAAYAIVATSETALYANILLKKGVVI